ncbi:hypothetical protein [Rubellicoccus peritrichatus]|uniref:Uncharacterized protein n=1 Tax=Rubellicoccus peritrichatus TaxID=3080537 RepID=A0AAQ3QSN5_9BACT|nr:hypothetical protein [Puniceicoccus sp. CR14]WOO40403.1 hypothetical protein RZN69_17425 [Puniceicoccus sp. CR14]WOO40452.1 hypothetical protein RZN69_17670 [Puniceicoccus sp. CR14]WOO40501.1 hypothetical protein RZN69_17915 [Puniceicoccus sp. CR14]WOO40551.1 hypothetical protein RZN69_18165 [Puniceicoccus sp. CR14]
MTELVEAFIETNDDYYEIVMEIKLSYLHETGDLVRVYYKDSEEELLRPLVDKLINDETWEAIIDCAFDGSNFSEGLFIESLAAEAYAEAMNPLAAA